MTYEQGRGQNLGQPNVERPIFRNFKILNIKGTKDELFDLLFLIKKKLFVKII